MNNRALVWHTQKSLRPRKICYKSVSTVNSEGRDENDLSKACVEITALASVGLDMEIKIQHQ